MSTRDIRESGFVLLVTAFIVAALLALPAASSPAPETIKRLAPWLKPETVKKYADLVAFESRWYSLDSVTVMAYITIESGWGADKVSKTNDYGLGQVHVGKHSPRFLGKEKELLDPRTNIRETCRILAMWKRFHGRWCKAGHPWIAHVKWGRRIPTKKGALSHAGRVQVVHDKIKGWR